MSEARRALTDDQLAAAAAGLRDRLLGSIGPDSPGMVAGYRAYRGEIDPEPALRALHDAGWKVVLPVVGPEVSLGFAPWIPEVTRFSRNALGIAEPDSPVVDPTVIDLVLVPGVAFDASGGRLGHGAGYYDRFFARLEKSGARPRRWGLAHDIQVVDEVPVEPWDVPMDVVVTPSRVISVGENPMSPS